MLPSESAVELGTHTLDVLHVATAVMLEVLSPYRYIAMSRLAALVVEGPTLGLPLLIAGIVALRRRHWLALAIAADRATSADTAQAGDTVLHGVVEAELAPIRVEIDQQGYHGLWAETKRRIVATPFTLRTAAGDRVRVEPDQHVLLMRTIDHTIQRSEKLRTRVAELPPGDLVYLAGALEPEPLAQRPHRQGSPVATLRRSTRGPLIVASTAPREYFEQRAKYLASKAVGVLLFALAAHCLFESLWRFDLQLLAIGSSSIVTVTRIVGIVVFSGLAFAHFFVRLPWYAGELREDERRRNV